MKVTFDDLYLITVSEDGTIMMWKIQDREGRTLKREKDVGWAEEILITKSDLEEKVYYDAELWNLYCISSPTCWASFVLCKGYRDKLSLMLGMSKLCFGRLKYIE